MAKFMQVWIYVCLLGVSSFASAAANTDFASLEPPQGDDGVWQFEVAGEHHSGAYFNAFQRSQAMLYRTLGWGWPTAKLTAEGNIDTMRFYQQQHQEKRAYTYVIRNSEQRIQGALFINPVQSRAGVIGYNAREFEVEVTFWLNQEGQDSDHANQLIPQVTRWLQQEWGIRSAVFPAARSNHFARQQYEHAGFDFVADDSNNNEILYRFRAR